VTVTTAKATTLNFGEAQAMISGVVFNDANGNVSRKVFGYRKS